ncbi:unnamed protein product [Symbiodinium sp. KB8]|nr:unnamed protein product [Symbiodinium sp. KB8]
MAMDERLFVGLDAGTFQPKASALSELRFAKEGLDFRRRDLEEARKRLRATQRRLAAACEAFRAERAGLQAELRALGQSGEQLGQSLASQQVLLQQQAESLDHERLTVDVLKDEVRRMREEQQKYRSTFIAVQEDDVKAGRRTRSLPPRLGSVDTEAVESRYVGNLLQRHAASFGLKEETSNGDCVEKAAEEAQFQEAEQLATNDGSFGVRASLRAVHAWQLRSGPKGKLDKRQRQCFDSLNEHQVLSLLLPYVVARCEDQGIAEPMAEVLELIRGRLHESEAVTVPIPVPRSKSNFLRVILKRLSTARLVELVVQTQADGFSMRLQQALGRARAVMSP